MHKVAIVHPWMPQYRVEFFRLLIESMAEKEIHLDVFYGQTPPEWSDRNDSARPSYADELPTKFFRVGSRNVSLKRLKLSFFRDYDLIILEQAVRNLETYGLMLVKNQRTKIAFWGHGRTYTQQTRQLEERIKSGMTLRGAWFFGYTQEGVDAVLEKGYPKEQTTVVQNSIDTDKLAKHISSVTPSEIKAFAKTHDLSAGHTALYLGGLDASKRIDFLLISAKAVAMNDPKFRLIVVGSGSEASAIADASTKYPWLRPLGTLFGREKAIALSASDIMMNPGRVGLVAVDSLTAGVPIVTTDWPYHAPEFSYLTHDVTAIVSQDTVDSFTVETAALISDTQKLRQMQSRCVAESKQYTTASMVNRFASGISGALAASFGNKSG